MHIEKGDQKKPMVSLNNRPSASPDHRRGYVQTIVGIPALLARGLIRVYRYSLSSLVGRTCRHLPTCSEYADIAIGRFGLWRGAWMALARFWRCRPFGTHGFDPVPEILPGDARWFLPWRYGLWAECNASAGR